MNEVAYFEIQVDDPQKAISFYSQVFGWKFVKDQNIPVDYWRIQTEGSNGGLLKRPRKVLPGEYGTNAFVCSIQVENFDVTANNVIDNGGTVALPKFAVPGKCWQGYFIDTQGNTFGLFQVDEKAK